MTGAGKLDKRCLFIYCAIIFISGLMFLCGIFINTASGNELSRTEILELFHQAKDLFRQADQAASSNPELAESLYRQAAMRYESIVTKGDIQNGKLYYNIGNVYFRIKDIGRAILNYRRAQEYIPNDLNLRQSLLYARNFRKDKIDEKQETKVFKTLFFWHYDLSTKIKIIVFSILFCAIWLTAGIRLFLKQSILSWGLFGAVVLSIMIGGSLIAESISLHEEIPGVVIDNEVVARKGNNQNYAPSFTEPLHAGTEFNLLEKRENWLYIELPDSRTCWVPAKSVDLVRP
jgi:tetratricopeptide (TPR) repeat protein